MATLTTASAGSIAPVTESQKPTYSTSGSTLPTFEYQEPFDLGWVTPATTTQNLTSDDVSVEESTKEDEKSSEHLEEVDADRRLLCNCYSYVREVYDNLPMTRTILSNLSLEGEVAVFYYPTSDVHHYAVVVDRKDGYITIDETNFSSCQFSRRVISEDYAPLLGFYSLS